jgi:diaminohydroxyphosphoribosylaminopyrimidine deaminase / 5-amino-6-(5-phosphoribosylamino)uracil reductase
MPASATTHELFMQRCFDLARLGMGMVAPNPLVGCAIVADNRVIGEGWHQAYGHAHAEINAIDAIKQADRPLLKDATLYVNLEPCMHYGNTPPCAVRIIQEGIPRIVIANTDVDPRVAGKGIEQLRKAGIEVISGLLEKEGLYLNRHFFTFHQKKRPYITLKWAQTKDGFIGRNGKRTSISGEVALRFTHRLRATHAGILVGSTTALIDNPALTVRHANGRDPVRILIDDNLRVPYDARLFNMPGKVFIFNEMREETTENIQYIRIGQLKPLLPQLMETLHLQAIQSVLVEGGAYTLQQFINEGLWDEAFVYEAPIILGKGVAAPIISTMPGNVSSLGPDRLYHYTRTS